MKIQEAWNLYCSGKTRRISCDTLCNSNFYHYCSNFPFIIIFLFQGEYKWRDFVSRNHEHFHPITVSFRKQQTTSSAILDWYRYKQWWYKYVVSRQYSSGKQVNCKERERNILYIMKYLFFTLGGAPKTNMRKSIVQIYLRYIQLKNRADDWRMGISFWRV
jgi:hypothetical protein